MAKFARLLGSFIRDEAKAEGAMMFYSEFVRCYNKKEKEQKKEEEHKGDTWLSLMFRG